VTDPLVAMTTRKGAPAEDCCLAIAVDSPRLARRGHAAHPVNYRVSAWHAGCGDGSMRRSCLAAAVFVSSLLSAPTASAEGAGAPPAKEKPWCGPDVTTLSDHVCYVDGGPAATGRRTLVIYLHGVLAKSPGFQYVQQRWMAQEAKSNSFTLLMPTAPDTSGYYAWPGSAKALKEEVAILDGIKKARADLERRAGAPFDETFVVGFSSGAYYASSLAARGALAVDGYIVLAGGGAWMKPGEEPATRAPVFVGVSAADPSSADHARAFAGVLAAAHWPFRAETRNTGHGVDRAFMAHGLTWLRATVAARPTSVNREVLAAREAM
jgi:predicted esterase